MKDIQSILMSMFPNTEVSDVGQLVFLNQHEIIKLDFPRVQSITKLEFYRAKFSTGYRKFAIIDVVLGLSKNKDVFMLTNPVFSDKNSNLVKKFEDVKSEYVDKSFIADLVEIYRATGVNITDVNAFKYQIWFGNQKWRILEFETNGTLVIKSKPNSKLPK